MSNTPIIIGLVGHARTGKDTVAERLVNQHGFTRFALADAVRHMAGRICGPALNGGGPPYTPEWLGYWEKAKDDFPELTRRALQDTGMAARKIMGEDIWIKVLERRMAEQPELKRVVITDIRFVNEAEWLSTKPGGQVWEVRRPGVVAINGHAAEASVDAAAALSHCVIVNDGTTQDLADAVDKMASLQQVSA